MAAGAPPPPLGALPLRRSHTLKGAKKLLANPRVVLAAVILPSFALLAIFAPWLTPWAIDDMDITQRLAPPSFAHPLGMDINGADVWTGMLYGARTSLYVGFLTVLLSLGFGVSIGLVAGYFGRWVDQVAMRLVDLLMAFPGTLLAMALAALLGPSLHNVVLAISATGWTSSARLIRGQVLSLRERDYVLASRALGAGAPRLLWLHVFPGTLSPLIVHATFSLSSVIIVEASLSFLGLGASGSAPSWGALLGMGRTVLMEAPHLSIIPGLAIMLVVLSLNFLGDALRDLADPRR